MIEVRPDIEGKNKAIIRGRPKCRLEESFLKTLH
jgi:hypothetical protein